MTEVDRKLASIRRIADVTAVPNADRLELALVDGWDVVTGKGQFVKGDLVVFFEIDSVLPGETDERFAGDDYAFLKSKKFIIKSARIRGVVSQGLVVGAKSLFDAVPLADVLRGADAAEEPAVISEHADAARLPQTWQDALEHEYGGDIAQLERAVLGCDVTALLNVSKHVTPDAGPSAGRSDMRGDFPPFLVKTSEQRIQNVFGRMAERLESASVVATDKVDGTSATFFRRGETFGVCSRNCLLKRPAWARVDGVEYAEGEMDENKAENDGGDVYWDIASRLDIEAKLAALDDDMCIQGEIVGPRIQSNYYGFVRTAFFMFSAYTVADKRRLTHDELQALGERLGIRCVPVVWTNRVLGKTDSRSIVVDAEGASILREHADAADLISEAQWAKMSKKGRAKKQDVEGILREGLVIRSLDPPLFSFKAISPSFLLR